MPDITTITHYPLKAIFAIHLVLVSWSLQAFWCPKSFLFYNLLFLLCLMWAVHNVESDEPLQFALAINVIAILLDVIILAIYWPNGYGADRFSGAIMIINLLVRLPTTLSLFRMGQSRGGTISALFPPDRGMDYSRDDYEHIPYPAANTSDFARI